MNVNRFKKNRRKNILKRGDTMMHMMYYPQAGTQAGTMMMGGGMLGMGIMLLIWLAVGSFVFSWIFWKTHQWVHKKGKSHS